MENPYAPPSQAASEPVVDNSQSGMAMRKRASWLRALGGSFVLRAVAINLTIFLTMLVVRRLLGRRMHPDDFAYARLVDLPTLVFTVIAMWKTTAGGVPSQIASKRLRPIARWFTVAWALVALVFRITDLSSGIASLMHLERGMFTVVMALTSAYAASVAPGVRLRRFAYAAALLALASLPWRYLLNVHLLAHLGVLSTTVIVTLLVARNEP